MICANSLRCSETGFGADTNIITVITKDGDTELELMSKDSVANEILTIIRNNISHA